MMETNNNHIPDVLKSIKTSSFEVHAINYRDYCRFPELCSVNVEIKDDSIVISGELDITIKVISYSRLFLHGYDAHDESLKYNISPNILWRDYGFGHIICAYKKMDNFNEPVAMLYLIEKNNGTI